MKHAKNSLSMSTALILAAMSIQLAAQTIVTGEIAGTITDPTRAGIPKIEVTAKSDATGESRRAISNESGEFRFAILPPGVYTLSAAAPGFQPLTVKATVGLGQIANVNLKMSLQTVTEVIDVSSEAPLLESQNANVATSLGISQLEHLPAGGNDLLAYTLGTPGTVSNTQGAYGGFSLFGLPATSNLFSTNGADIMDPYLNINNSGASNLTLGSNEVQEAAVITNAYTGQYGRQAGAQINYITKSGSNAFHGNAAWNYNGAALNANDFFNNANATDRPHAVSNGWAGSLGGPIKKDKLFFFYDNEGLRYVLPSGGPIYIPTTAFSNYVLTNLNGTTPAAVPFYTKMFNIYAGSSGAARATNVTAALDPTLGCGDFAGGGFGPGGSPCARQFQSSVNALNTEWLTAERIDFNATDKDRLYFRAWTDRGVQATATDAINPAFSANSVQPQWSAQLGYTRVISPRAVNELRISGSYYSALFGPPNLAAALAVFPTTISFGSTIGGDGLFSSVGGGATPNGPSLDGLLNFPNGRKVSQWQIVDDYAYSWGKHQFKFGGNVRRNDVGDYGAGPGTSGSMLINSMTEFVNGVSAGLTTYAQTFTRVGAEHIGLYSIGIYAQDEWKVTPKLTVSASIRFEREGNPTCGRNCYSRFPGTFEELNHDPTQPYNSAIQLNLHNAFKNLDGIITEPRAGIAYKVGSKTVIRAGVGLFSDALAGNLNQRFFLNAPNVASFTGTSGVLAPGVAGSIFANVATSNAAFQSGFANGATLAQLQTAVPGFSIPNFYTVADNFHIPKYTEWNVEVQQELTTRLLLSVNYVGNKGWDEVNQTPFPNAWSTQGFGGLPTAAPDKRFGEINELASTGHSNYNGLVSSLRWRLKSVTASVSYTWGHALDTCSNNCRLQFNLLTAPSLRYDFSPAGANASYGNADYDVRHSFNASYVWAIPARVQNYALKEILGGWNVGGFFQARTAFPFTVVNSGLRSKYTKNTSGIATLSIPADWSGGTASTSCTVPNTSCFTTSQFQTTAQQSNFGNLARNSFRGPGYFDTDLTVNKNIAIHERYTLIVGATFFNVLNHPNFDLPGNNIAGGNFGTIQSTVSPFSSAYGAFTGSSVSGRLVVTNLKFQF
jgi:hypothetical protein